MTESNHFYLKLFWIILPLFPLLLILSVEKPDPYEKFNKQVDSLEADSNFVAARQLLAAGREDFPEHAFDLMKREIRLNEKAGCFECNIDIWSQGHKKGLFFLLHRRIPRYQPYVEFPEFEALEKQDAELRMKALQQAETSYEFQKARRVPAHDAATLLVFHGGGSSLSEAKSRWKFSKNFRNDHNLIFFQSYRHYDSDSFGWRTGDPRTHHDIDSCFSEVMDSYQIDINKIYLTGISAGASMALDLSARAIIPSEKLLLFCPGFPAPAFENLSETHFSNGIHIIAGENDFYHEKQEQLIVILDSLQIYHTFDMIGGFGHDLPKDFERYLTKYINL